MSTHSGAPDEQQIYHFCSLGWHSLVIVPLLRTVRVVKHYLAIWHTLEIGHLEYTAHLEPDGGCAQNIEAMSR